MPLTRREPQAYGTTKPGGARRLALLYVLGCIMRQSLVITNTGPPRQLRLSPGTPTGRRVASYYRL